MPKPKTAKTTRPPVSRTELRLSWAEKEARILGRELPFRRVHVHLDTRALAETLADARDAETAASKALLGVADGEPGPERTSAYADALQAVLDAQTAVEEDVEALDFEGMWRSDYEELIGEHPPTKEQLDAGQEYNVETFAPALLATCSLDGMDEPAAARLLEGMSQVEAGLLFNTCIALCESARMSIVPNARRAS